MYLRGVRVRTRVEDSEDAKPERLAIFTYSIHISTRAHTRHNLFTIGEDSSHQYSKQENE